MIDQLIQTIEKIEESAPFTQSEITRQSFDDLMRYDLKSDKLIIGKRVNYFEKKYKKGWPLVLSIDYSINNPSDDFEEILIGIVSKMQKFKEERSWNIQKLLMPMIPDIQELLKNFVINDIDMKSLSDEKIENDNIEYYVALSYFKNKVLKDPLVYYLLTFIFGFWKIHKHCLDQSIDPLFKEAMKTTDLNRNISKPMEEKKGVQFFGTDTRYIDYSVTAHKDVFTQVQNNAKSLERFCSINEDPKELVYWIKRYVHRPTFSYWQESLGNLEAMSWGW